MLEYNQLKKELNGTQNELYETKKGLDKSGNDINEKTKYTDKLKEIQEKLDYQNDKETKLENELNEKNKNIKDLENIIIEIMTEHNEINKIYIDIKEKFNEEIQKLKKNLSENKGYLDYYEKSNIKMKEKIDEINELNNELNKENQEIKKELDKYKEKLYTLNNGYNKIKDVSQNELEKNIIKESKLNELNNKYLEEKQIMEQEINKKKQQLQDDNIKISKLKKSKNVLIKGFKKHEIINKLKIKENDKLKDEIRKLRESNIELGRTPTLIQDLEKKDDKARLLLHLIKERQKKISDFKELQEISKDRDIDELLKDNDNDKYVNINLSNVNDLIDEVKKNFEKRNNILDIRNNKSINFNDILNFLQDIIDSEVHDFNKEEKYNEKFKDVEKNLEIRTKNSNDIRLYNYYLDYLKKIVFSTRKSSGKGLTISAFPILLSKIYTNNSSKEITNEIKQLTKELYNNKQITKQLYDVLNKALRQRPQHL